MFYCDVYRTACDIGKFKSSKSICKVPQHIEKDVIIVPDANNGIVPTKSNDQSNSSQLLTAERSSGRALTQESPKSNEDGVTIKLGTEKSKIGTVWKWETKRNADVGQRTIGINPTATQAPMSKTVWTEMTRWGWKLVLNPCNLLIYNDLT